MRHLIALTLTVALTAASCGKNTTTTDDTGPDDEATETVADVDQTTTTTAADLHGMTPVDIAHIAVELCADLDDQQDTTGDGFDFTETRQRSRLAGIRIELADAPELHRQVMLATVDECPRHGLLIRDHLDAV